jgi:hypothetical protein
MDLLSLEWYSHTCLPISPSVLYIRVSVSLSLCLSLSLSLSLSLYIYIYIVTPLYLHFLFYSRQRKIMSVDIIFLEVEGVTRC